jgi:hypothetical protein
MLRPEFNVCGGETDRLWGRFLCPVRNVRMSPSPRDQTHYATKAFRDHGGKDPHILIYTEADGHLQASAAFSGALSPRVVSEHGCDRQSSCWTRAATLLHGVHQLQFRELSLATVVTVAYVSVLSQNLPEENRANVYRATRSTGTIQIPHCTCRPLRLCACNVSHLHMFHLSVFAFP